MTRRRAFTLIEMLVAAALTAVLLAGVLSVSAALARDARRTSARATDAAGTDAAFELIRWDLLNAQTIASDGPLTLTGHGGLSRDTMRPTGRLARVTYSIRRGVGLVREQRYLDDQVRPEPWSELVIGGATEIETLPARSDSHGLTVRIGLRDGTSVVRTLTR